ncbi:hypothetical protein JOD45_001948 [Scopulibacillus daqui]|uniref:Spore germination protein GerPA/GerPF n=1 Tax=Scopulibacillus daqui TaxID=1469162 RepID=A0ABS2Q0B2_9BACL|nr:hypothetical protein [Scopulibacillus daqui]MBM7645729.1 hypothetical protein [Scopulibacillus daqui]
MREINIGSLKINAYDQLSTVTFSQSIAVKKYSKTKKSQGFGEQSGDCVISQPDGMILDHDIADSQVRAGKRF